MRAILIDWLVQVNLKFRLLQETMYMTVGMIDRFLQVSNWIKEECTFYYMALFDMLHTCI